MFKNLKMKAREFLIWSQRYTKTDMLYFTKSGFWLTVNNIYTVITGLISSVLFANLFSPENYGTYRYILALSATISSFSFTAGLDKALIPTFAKGNDGMYKRAFLISLKWGLAIPLICSATSIYYFLHGQVVLGWSMLIIGLFAPIQESAGIYAPYISGKKQFKIFSIYNAIQTTLYLSVITIAVLTTTNIILIVLSYFLINTTIITAYYFITPKIIKLQNNNIDDGALTFAKHISVMGILTGIAAQIDKILVFHFLGAAPLAIYSFATKPVDLLSDITKGLLKDITLPKLSQKTVSQIKSGLPSKILRVFIMSVIIFVIYILLAPIFFKLIFPKYIDSILYSQIMAISLLLMMDVFWAQTFFAHAKKKQLYIMNTSVSLTKIILSFIFLPLFGLWGLIASRLLAQAIYDIILFVLFKKYKN